MKHWQSNNSTIKRYRNKILKNKKKILKYLEQSRYLEGEKGFSIRYAIYSIILNKLGENVKIFPGVYILYPEHLSIGKNVTLHEFSILECNGNVTIGNSTSIAHRFSLLSSTHNFDHLTKPFRELGFSKEKVSIGNFVWIGCDVKILLGVKIGNKSVIGANSLVNKSFPPNSLLAGSPAKLIRKINQKK